MAVTIFEKGTPILAELASAMLVVGTEDGIFLSWQYSTSDTLCRCNERKRILVTIARLVDVYESTNRTKVTPLHHSAPHPQTSISTT